MEKTKRKKQAERYLKAGPVGGLLIREVIKTFKDQAVTLPLNSHILIAVSGGADSVALAHLMIHYGRKVLQPSQVTLLHINHQWRGIHSDEDAEFVHQLGLKWGVPVVIRRVEPPVEGLGDSWEDHARRARKTIFREESERLNASSILTAHHADDLAETVLWRLFTGAVERLGGGILFRTGLEVRPFLTIRKKRLFLYLDEVGQDYREDQTNRSDRFLRSRMRKVLMPEVEKLFPQGVPSLVAFALRNQGVRWPRTGD